MSTMERLKGKGTMKNKFVYILVLMLLIPIFSSFCQINEINIKQVSNQAEDSNTDSFLPDSFNLLRQTNENISIYLNAGFNIITYANMTTDFKAYAYCSNLSLIEYYWDFNNNGIYDLTTLELDYEPSEVNYSYNETGNYTVKIEARAPWGNISSAFDYINVWVKNGTGNQEYVNPLESEKQIGPSNQSPSPDGNIDKYAVMINGGYEERFWWDVNFTYKMLINEYDFYPHDIYLFNYNGSNPYGENPNNMIDFTANHHDIHEVLNDLAGEIDGDDILLVWATDHGDGMYGSHVGENSLKYGYIPYTINVSVDPGDEQDCLESDFKFRTWTVGGKYSSHIGMGCWGLYHYPWTPLGAVYCRRKYVSNFTNVYFEEINETISDNDILIEKFEDYLEGDFNNNSIIEEGEIIDWDNDGNPPYNETTGEYDEDDWGDIHRLKDDFNQVYTSVPGGEYVIFDDGFDNCVDIDLDTTYFEENGTLVVDGTDTDNKGLFDGCDINSDGDKDDWVSVDEAINLYQKPHLLDDDLALWLKDIKAGRIITVLEPCFSGGFLWDISGPLRIACSATTDDDISLANWFIDGITAALYWEDMSGNPVDADTNDDGNVSLVEAFNYAVENDPGYPFEDPQYDDNGDGITHDYPIPQDDDGKLGEKTYLWGYEMSENPPNRPDRPQGNILIKINVSYNYSTSTVDLDGDQVFYKWDWGDGNFSDWLGPYDSNQTANASHTWMEKGTYLIKVKAMDIFGDESEWSKPLPIIVPKSKFFGKTMSGVLNQNVKNKIAGSYFNVLANGTANYIIAYIQTNLSTPPKTKGMIYRVNDSKLIGTTEEKIMNTGDEGAWVMYNFSNPKPNLTTNTEYTLVCWSNDTCNFSYDTSNDPYARYKSYTYGTDLSPTITWDANESRLYSVCCGYSTVPEIKSVSASPNLIGFGYNTNITVDVEHYGIFIDTITVNITYPNSITGNFSMIQVDNDTFQYIFNDAWDVGRYNYSIWVVDEFGANCSSTDHSFNVSADATISVCTLKDEYGNNETINLTDPPAGSPKIGYELLDNGEVLHIWNKFDSYYFDTSSGIQLTNHYNEYWSHNVLMLGYYNNNQWNLIYRTDELSGFNKEIDSDSETYVNATLWKDLTYGGYDFRLAIRYHLGVDDNELMVIPYIKNLDEDDIPYVLGFGWEMKNIQIDMTPEGDYIEVNRTMYYLDETLNKVYTDLSEPVFYLMENITRESTKSLYLRWDESLIYKLQVKSRTGQYNAPVTLFVRIGTLDANQEKYTKMYWYDADQVTYYFDSYDDSHLGEAWTTNPEYMVDGNPSNTASTTVDGDVELCNENECSGNDIGTISMVELRVSSYYTCSQRETILRPVFGGTTDGIDCRYQTPSGVGPVWSPWFDITHDPFAPQTWSWTDVDNLDCDVEVGFDMLGFTLYCSKLEIRVTYTPYSPPEISNPYPSNGCIGISLTPMLNITVSDKNGDNMNITWLSNSSGSWQVFGTNNSVSNGTYHQTMSNASVNGRWWYWKVNVTDGTLYNESSVYKFYTGYQSKIENTGSTDIKGYLLIQVQYFNETSEIWIVADDTINEATPRTINSSDQFGLDTVFNSLVNTQDLSGIGNGTYRIYAAFRDPDGDVLVCDDETELVATYEFEITFN